MDPQKALDSFHPAVREWFLENIGTPSLPQAMGWPEIRAGKNVLISAPTGAGKTLAAFLESIDNLLKMGLKSELPEGVFVLYVSPLKALNNDIYKNLDIPLEGIKKAITSSGLEFPDIRKAVRTGDTPQHERQRMLKAPPHILITTPESLYLMLTSKNASHFLKKVRYLIVDEIHTMLGNKRGVHLALSIARLEHLAENELIRIGLSATVNPIEAAAYYLGGLKKTENGYIRRPVSIVAPPMERTKDLSIHMPVSDFRVLEQNTIWPEIYDAIYKLIQKQRSTIVFVNNRAVAERVAANLNSMSEKPICRPHHGSLSKNKRLEVEDQFKSGELTCMIATSTLELGIDVGSVDLMIQVASPVSVSGGLQRLGRAGHRLNAVSKGRIIPKTRGDLLRSAFIAKEMAEGNIEKENIPLNCLDILAQHIVSMSCNGPWTEDDMLEVIRSAWSYKDLREADFRRVLAMLAGDYEHEEDIPAKPRIGWDRKNKTVEGTPYSRMLAVNSSGTIPDRGYFAVYLEDYKTRIGELDEVFVFEARIGDKFLLGNSSWMIQKIEKDRVIVSPTGSVGARAPFWQGDGIGGPFEQGLAFGRFLRTLSDKLESEDFIPYLTSTGLLDETAALNIKNYLTDQMETMGCLSHDKRIVVEYCKDNDAEQSIIIHSHFGGRVNSVLAILLQKAIEDTIGCQAYANHNNDAIFVRIYGCPDDLSNVLSLIKPAQVEIMLLSMLPSTSRFAMTFRYNAYRSLMMGVRNVGQRLPLWLQRLRSVDAFESARKTLDHPLLIETMRECLEEIFDIPNTIELLNSIQQGTIEVVEKRTWFPSPFASEMLLEYKRVMMYAERDPHPARIHQPVLSGIDALPLSYRRDQKAAPINKEAVREVINKSCAAAKLSEIKSAGELHSYLLIYGDLTRDEIPEGPVKEWLEQLIKDRRVLLFKGDTEKYIAVEEMGLYQAAEGIKEDPGGAWAETGFSEATDDWSEDSAINRIIRRYARYRSPFSAEDIQKRYSIDPHKINRSLNELKAEGLLVRGYFLKEDIEELCHARVFETILRKESMLNANAVIARDPQVLAAFLPVWQKIGTDTVSPETTLYQTIRQLEGLYLPVEYWESIVFPARIKGYSPALLDRLCASGKVFWRLLPQGQDKKPALAWFCVESTALDPDAAPPSDDGLDDSAKRVLQALRQRGASFTHVLSGFCGMPSSELLEILEGLVFRGLVVNDSFSALRYFINKPAKSLSVPADRDRVLKAKRTAWAVSKTDMGRWEIAWPVKDDDLQRHIDRWLARYGLICHEVFSLEVCGFSWNEVYEALKQREYAGSLLRGYFFKGISGIQFMLPEAWQRLELANSMQVLNACDPSQVFGKILPHSESGLSFTNIPGNVIVLDSGNPILVFERFGESIALSCDTDKIESAVMAFKDAFDRRRILPDRKKIMVKDWPENATSRELLQTSLKNAGFKSEITRMILYRSSI